MKELIEILSCLASQVNLWVPMFLVQAQNRVAMLTTVMISKTKLSIKQILKERELFSR